MYASTLGTSFPNHSRAACSVCVQMGKDSFTLSERWNSTVPTAHRWHQVIVRHTTGTDYTVSMLYLSGRGATFYAGQDGQASRHQARRPPQPALAADPGGRV